jgi:hypothetical protein
MFTEVTVKFTTPDPELLAENNPVKVAEKESLPAIGTVCVMVSVNVPDAAIVPVPEKNVWKLPKLVPVGVFKLVDPRPVKVIMIALPMPPKKVTELVPLPAQPAHVKVPDVEKVTGSAFALDVPNAITASRSTPITVALKISSIFVSSLRELRSERPHAALTRESVNLPPSCSVFGCGARAALDIFRVAGSSNSSAAVGDKRPRLDWLGASIRALKPISHD